MFSNSGTQVFSNDLVTYMQGNIDASLFKGYIGFSNERGEIKLGVISKRDMRRSDHNRFSRLNIYYFLENRYMRNWYQFRI